MARDPFKYFRVEARELLEQLAQGALDLEKDGSRPDVVAHMLRVAHTLKGAARVVRQREIADAAHALEDVLTQVRELPAPARARIDALFAHLDTIGQHVRALAPPEPAGSGNVEDSRPAGLAFESAAGGFRPVVEDLDALLSGVNEAHIRLRALRPAVAGLERGRRLLDVVSTRCARRRGEQDELQARGARASGVAADDIRELLGRIERDLGATIDQVDRELGQVRDAAERLRLTPAETLLRYLERAVRETARATGRDVRFESSGGDVRVDGPVLEVLQGALLQVVRNAVTHGIEPPGERQAAGKPRTGTVAVHVSQRGRRASFACTDDGRGIDVAAVRRAAVRQGAGASIDEVPAEEVLRALLRGGISTATTVTEMSGRGVGFDVVRDAAVRLAGEATARTDPGRGTTITLVVPLSVAAFQAIVVAPGADSVAIPLDAVRGTLRLDAGTVRSEARPSVLFDGELLPLVDLGELLRQRASAGAAAGRNAVVVEARSRRVAFRVGRIIGTGDVVMRALPSLAPADPTVAGLMLDSRGDAQLVLDPEGLIDAAARHTHAVVTPSEPAHILVIDDSMTTRMLEQSILESAGYRVDVAASAEEGLARARRQPYALFLVDVEMPGMDGFTFVETLRADARLREVPAILVTSRMAPEDRRRGRDAGAQDYIVKSQFDQGLLLARIGELVNR